MSDRRWSNRPAGEPGRGRDKVTGGARYTADTAVRGVQYAVLVQSTVAHGRITADSLAAAAARAQSAPG